MLTNPLNMLNDPIIQISIVLGEKMMVGLIESISTSKNKIKGLFCFLTNKEKNLNYFYF